MRAPGLRRTASAELLCGEVVRQLAQVLLLFGQCELNHCCSSLAWSRIAARDERQHRFWLAVTPGHVRDDEDA